MIIPPTIPLTGVRLRPLRVEDAAAWHSYLSDPAVLEGTSYPIMSQAVTACVDWVFGLPEFGRVEAHVMVGNRRSERVLARARFRRKALLKAYRTCRGQPRDYRLFTLSRAEWSIIGDGHQ